MHLLARRQHRTTLSATRLILKDRLGQLVLQPRRLDLKVTQPLGVRHIHVHTQYAASLKPCLRQRLFIAIPVSVSRRKPMICSQENRLFTPNRLHSEGLDSKSLRYSKTHYVGLAKNHPPTFCFPGHRPE